MREEVAKQGGKEINEVQRQEDPRNGYQTHMKTRYGELIFLKIQLREISIYTNLFNRHSIIDKALVNALA